MKNSLFSSLKIEIVANKNLIRFIIKSNTYIWKEEVYYILLLDKYEEFHKALQFNG